MPIAKPPAPPVLIRSRRTVAALGWATAASADPSLDALSTTRIAVGWTVCAYSASRQASSMSRRSWATTTATTRGSLPVRHPRAEGPGSERHVTRAGYGPSVAFRRPRKGAPAGQRSSQQVGQYPAGPGGQVGVTASQRVQHRAVHRGPDGPAMADPA